MQSRMNSAQPPLVPQSQNLSSANLLVEEQCLTQTLKDVDSTLSLIESRLANCRSWLINGKYVGENVDFDWLEAMRPTPIEWTADEPLSPHDAQSTIATVTWCEGVLRMIGLSIWDEMVANLEKLEGAWQTKLDKRLNNHLYSNKAVKGLEFVENTKATMDNVYARVGRLKFDTETLKLLWSQQFA